MELPNLLTGFIIAIIVALLVAWGMNELIDWLLINDAIRVTEPLVPELELTVKDNVIDTIYVYRLPE